MSQTTNVQDKTLQEWTLIEKFAFRTSLIFMFLFCIPTTEGWWKRLFKIDFFNLHYRDLYDIARFQPNFFSKNIPIQIDRWGLGGYFDWLCILGVAILGAAIWSFLDSKARNYTKAYYWLRVMVRYRAAIGIIGFGYTKLFPVQMPFPSESLLNNNFGDLTGHKVFWLSIAIVPWFQVFTGIVEIVAGFLLFFRKTTFIGAMLLMGTLGTITVVNFSYDGGVHVYAFYFVLLGWFLMSYDFKNLYQLFIKKKKTIPAHYYPEISGWKNGARLLLKYFTIILFVPIFFYYQYLNFRYDPYKQPAVAGEKALRGYYDVDLFVINGDTIPYSPLDSLRWQEVTFEKWTTMTYKVNKTHPLELSNGGGDPQRDIDRTFEVSGVAGGRRVFHYQADTLHQTLYLQDKNTALMYGAKGAFNEAPVKKKTEPIEDNWIPDSAKKYIKDQAYGIASVAITPRRLNEFAELGGDDHLRPRMVLSYTTDNQGEDVILEGTDEYNRSLYVVLKRVDRTYAIKESKLVAGQYD